MQSYLNWIYHHHHLCRRQQHQQQHQKQHQLHHTISYTAISYDAEVRCCLTLCCCCCCSRQMILASLPLRAAALLQHIPYVFICRDHCHLMQWHMCVLLNNYYSSCAAQDVPPPNRSDMPVEHIGDGTSRETDYMQSDVWRETNTTLPYRKLVGDWIW